MLLLLLTLEILVILLQILVLLLNIVNLKELNVIFQKSFFVGFRKRIIRIHIILANFKLILQNLLLTQLKLTQLH